MTYSLLIILAFTLSSKEPDFEKYVKAHEEAFIDWRERNHGDFKSYLDAKVLEFRRPKDVKALKKQVYLLALYHVKKESPSKIILESAQKYDQALKDLKVKTLTWDMLLEKIQSFDEP